MEKQALLRRKAKGVLSMKKRTFAALAAAVILLSGCGGEPESVPSGQPSRESSSVTSTSSSSSSGSSVESSSSSSVENSSSSPSSESSSSSSESAEPERPMTEEEIKYADAPAPTIASNTKPADYSAEPVEFQEDIDDFYARVREMPVPSEDAEAYDRLVNDGFSVRKLEIDGVPLYEVKKDDGQLKPLVIIMHGGGGHKNIEDAAAPAYNDFCGVSIDCAGHGESSDGPLQAPAAFLETVKDIDTLIEYYNTVPDADAENFGLTGASMGGNIALWYVVYGKYKPTAIEAALACPGPLTGGPIRDCFDKGQSGLPAIWTGRQITNFAADFQPANHPEMFTDVWVYAACGENDYDNNPVRMENFKRAVEELGGEKFVCHVFEGIGHESIPQSWYENEEAEFFSRLRA